MRFGMNELKATDIRQPGVSPERAITNSVGQTIRTRGSVRSIQELAGHQNLTTTQRYMHLTPATLEATIRLLNQPLDVSIVGDMLETGRSQMTN